MKSFVRKTLRFFLVVVLACLGVICVALLGVGLYRLVTAPDPHSPEALLKKADEMAWLNNWIAAEPLYQQAELTFVQQHKTAKALLLACQSDSRHIGDQRHTDFNLDSHAIPDEVRGARPGDASAHSDDPWHG